MTGYGDRDRRSEGVYQALRAGAVYLGGAAESALVLAADLIGFDLAFAARTKLEIAQATGLLPHQIALTATHTHCGPLFYPFIMPGEPDLVYAEWLGERLVEIAVRARTNAVEGRVAFSRSRSSFGVNRRLPEAGSVLMAPNPDGPIDRDLDTLWFSDAGGTLLGTLTIYGCHATSLAGYLIGGDYPGYLCRALEEETRAPALFSTGCAGDVRPWFNPGGRGFQRPSIDGVEAAGRAIAVEVLEGRDAADEIDGRPLRATGVFHQLPYESLPDAAYLAEVVERESGLRRTWARYVQELLAHGSLPGYCPQEVMVVQLTPDFRIVFLGGEVLSEIGLRIKQVLAPATTVTVACSNGLIGYVPSRNAHALGGYEVSGSHHYFMRPAPFADHVEDCIVDAVTSLCQTLRS